MLWLAISGATPQGQEVEHLKTRLDALAAFTAELEQRLASAGVAGVGGALEVSHRVQALLGDVSLADIEQALRQIETLRRDLGELDRTLEQVRQLKKLLRA